MSAQPAEAQEPSPDADHRAGGPTAGPRADGRAAGIPEDRADRAGGLRRRLESVTGTPFTEGNEVTILRNGDEIFPAMLAAIRGARNTVDLMTFVYWKGDIAVAFADALSDRAQAGIRVRLLIDALGGRLIDTELVDRMDDAGVQVEWFRKPLLKSPFKANHRLHRKVCVVDETVAFKTIFFVTAAICSRCLPRRLP